jgi:hypothetical protein
MANRRKAKVDRLAKLKIVAIPVLLAVLGFVLWSNFSEKSDRPTANSKAKVAAKAKAKSATVVSKAGEKTDPKRKVVEAWPEPTLEFLNQESPFRSMEYEPPKSHNKRLVSKPKLEDRDSARDALASAAKMLRDATIRYTFRSANQSAFMFENRLIKEGDEFTKGVIVRSITDQGIELAVKDSEVMTLAPSVN